MKDKLFKKLVCKGLNIILASMVLMLFCSVCCAADGPHIRVLAPESVKAGDSFTAKIMLEFPAKAELGAVAATFGWDPARLQVVGYPSLNRDVYSDAGGSRFNTVLANKLNLQKNLVEVSIGKMGKAVAFAPGTSVQLMSVSFKVRDGASGKARIDFTTDKRLSANGTSCFTDNGDLPFSIITPAVITIK